MEELDEYSDMIHLFIIPGYSCYHPPQIQLSKRTSTFCGATIDKSPI